MTTAPGIFAAGDIAFGPRLIINAVADGKKAAEEIDKFIRGPEWKPKPQYVQITVLDHHKMAEQYDEYSRLAVPVIPLERRTGIAEVEIGFTEEQARREASRCLQCWINTIFEGNEAERQRMHPVRRLRGCLPGELPAARAAQPISSFPTKHADSSRPHPIRGLMELLHLSPDELSPQEGSVMVKDETICIRCGLCAERCPVNTITMEAFEVFDRDPNLVQIEEMVFHA